jgi:membrane-bound lytic murein transglycosylase D
MQRWVLALWIMMITGVMGPFPAWGQPGDARFPLYDVIKPNVSFWATIYGQHPSTRGVIHDSLRLDIVYDVIDLVSAETSGARRINRQRMKRACRRIERILSRLAADPRTEDDACRRVAALFGPDADGAVFAGARHRVRCQVGQWDRFRDGLVRSGAYIDQMRAILREHGVPPDLAYLPHVESSFNIHAYSKFGAAGMWQFTRSTGRRYMTVDYVLDERRDPIVATRAAARLLKENYAKLGSWPLAVTAYNHGAAGMQRAQAAHGDYPAIFTAYKGRTFKFASRNFYAEFLAARQVASAYERYFGPLALDSPKVVRSVALDGYAAFADLCRHFQVSQRTLRNLNPALRPPVLTGQKYIPKGYSLILPGPGNTDVDVGAAVPLALYREAQKPSRYHVVQRGDTAGKIARTHGIPLSDLMLANNLDRRATVYLRQTLRIPHTGEPLPQRIPQPDVSATPMPPRMAANGPSVAIPADLPVEDDRRRYRRPGTAPADRLALDGDAVSVPGGHLAAHIGFARPIRAGHPPIGVVRVDVEETLGHYAEWAGVQASRIRQLNRLPFGRALQLHQLIEIPLDRVAPAAFETRRYEFHKRLQEDFFAAYRIGELQQYHVQPGDNYWTLCRQKFDLPLWLLRYYNADVNLAALKIDQPLTVPAVESIPADHGAGVPREPQPEA